jgi:hypothetical protein
LGPKNSSWGWHREGDDDGHGGQPAQPDGSQGLPSMSERDGGVRCCGGEYV